MKAFLVFGLLGLLGILLSPLQDQITNPEESRRRFDEENQRTAEKLVENGIWWLSQPGSATELEDGGGAYQNFNLNPSPVSEFYSRGMLAGLGSLLPAGPSSELSLEERSRLEWKGKLQVKFEWVMGPHSEGKWIPVCCNLVVMRFIKPPS